MKLEYCCSPELHFRSELRIKISIPTKTLCLFETNCVADREGVGRSSITWLNGEISCLAMMGGTFVHLDCYVLINAGHNCVQAGAHGELMLQRVSDKGGLRLFLAHRGKSGLFTSFAAGAAYHMHMDLDCFWRHVNMGTCRHDVTMVADSGTCGINLCCSRARQSACALVRV